MLNYQIVTYNRNVDVWDTHYMFVPILPGKHNVSGGITGVLEVGLAEEK